MEKNHHQFVLLVLQAEGSHPLKSGLHSPEQKTRSSHVDEIKEENCIYIYNYVSIYRPFTKRSSQVGCEGLEPTRPANLAELLISDPAAVTAKARKPPGDHTP